MLETLRRGNNVRVSAGHRRRLIGRPSDGRPWKRAHGAGSNRDTGQAQIRGVAPNRLSPLKAGSIHLNFTYCYCSTASSSGLLQGCQIGDDVGAIPGLRQSLEEHFRAVNVPAWICEIGIQCGCSPRGLVRFHRFRIGIVRHAGRLTSYDAPEARSDLVYPDFCGVAVLADVLKDGLSGKPNHRRNPPQTPWQRTSPARQKEPRDRS
jgi:hypothetical protein